MSMDPGLNQLLQWSIENSDASKNSTDPSQAPSAGHEPRGLTQDALRALMGGPSDADLMKESMTVIVHPGATLDSKITAFDNFEQLIENLDNANNMEPLGLWSPLLDQLESPEAEIRKMAAWCAGTAIQNNTKSQEKFLASGGISKVCKVAVDDEDKAVRRKAVYTLSSGVRNHQPAMDEALKCLPKAIVGPDHVSASDMDVIDAIMAKLREAE